MVLPFLKNDYAKWSLIVLAGSLFASFLNYAFTLIMGRMLSPSFFGEVSAIFGLMVIIVAPTQAISNYISRHISFLAGKKDYLTAKVWLRKVSRSVFFFSLALLFLFWLAVPMLSRFLAIDPLPLIVFSFSIPFAFMLTVYAGALQGLKSFKAFSFQNILGAALKLSLAVIFVYIGLFVPGVMLALAVSLGAVCFYNYTKIKSLTSFTPHTSEDTLGEAIKSIFFRQRRIRLWRTKSFPPVFARALVELKRWRAGLTVFLAALLVAFISNIDVILAKHFFEPQLAGEYAALSAVGKILIYIASAFVTVMFVVVSESHTASSPRTFKAFRSALGYITAVSLPVIFVFGFAPNIVVRIFFGATYIKIAPHLPIFSIAMFLLSLSIAFVHYFLAIRNNSFLFPFAAGALLQIVLISLYHSSIQNIVISVLWSSTFLLFALVANYFLYGKFQTKRESGKI